MDPLVATIIGIIGPYLAKGADEFAKSAGKAAFEGTKKLVDRLSRWWKGDPVADATVSNFAAEPELNAEMLATRLAHAIKKDPSFADELRVLVDELGPNVDVIQKMEIARGVTGGKIGELVSGRVRVQQEMKDAQNVVGVEINRMGGGR